MSASKDPRKDAQEYIKEKRVDVLFQELGERLVFDRPENLNEYLLSVLQSMKKNKAEGQSTCFFTNEATSIATPDRQTDRQTLLSPWPCSIPSRNRTTHDAQVSLRL